VTAIVSYAAITGSVNFIGVLQRQGKGLKIARAYAMTKDKLRSPYVQAALQKAFPGGAWDFRGNIISLSDRK
jgi:hypothetical protein